MKIEGDKIKNVVRKECTEATNLSGKGGEEKGEGPGGDR